jgi:hypothetical protein
MLRVAEVDQRIQVMFGNENDIAALAAIAAVRATEFDKLLPPESDHTIATVTGAQVDLSLVEEFHGSGPEMKRGPAWTPTPAQT